MDIFIETKTDTSTQRKNIFFQCMYQSMMANPLHAYPQAATPTSKHIQI